MILIFVKTLTNSTLQKQTAACIYDIDYTAQKACKATCNSSISGTFGGISYCSNCIVSTEFFTITNVFINVAICVAGCGSGLRINSFCVPTNYLCRDFASYGIPGDLLLARITLPILKCVTISDAGCTSISYQTGPLDLECSSAAVQLTITYNSATYKFSKPSGGGFLVVDVPSQSYTFSYSCGQKTNADAPNICVTATCRTQSTPTHTTYVQNGTVCYNTDTACLRYYDDGVSDRVCTTCPTAGSFVEGKVCLAGGQVCSLPDVIHKLSEPTLLFCEAAHAGYMEYEGQYYESCSMTPVATMKATSGVACVTSCDLNEVKIIDTTDSGRQTRCMALVSATTVDVTTGFVISTCTAAKEIVMTNGANVYTFCNTCGSGLFAELSDASNFASFACVPAVQQTYFNHSGVSLPMSCEYATTIFPNDATKVIRTRLYEPLVVPAGQQDKQCVFPCPTGYFAENQGGTPVLYTCTLCLGGYPFQSYVQTLTVKEPQCVTTCDVVGSALQYFEKVTIDSTITQVCEQQCSQSSFIYFIGAVQECKLIPDGTDASTLYYTEVNVTATVSTYLGSAVVCANFIMKRTLTIGGIVYPDVQVCIASCSQMFIDAVTVTLCSASCPLFALTILSQKICSPCSTLQYVPASPIILASGQFTCGPCAGTDNQFKASDGSVLACFVTALSCPTAAALMLQPSYLQQNTITLDGSPATCVASCLMYLLGVQCTKCISTQGFRIESNKTCAAGCSIYQESTDGADTIKTCVTSCPQRYYLVSLGVYKCVTNSTECADPATQYVNYYTGKCEISTGSLAAGTFCSNSDIIMLYTNGISTNICIRKCSEINFFVGHLNSCVQTCSLNLISIYLGEKYCNTCVSPNIAKVLLTPTIQTITCILSVSTCADPLYIHKISATLSVCSNLACNAASSFNLQTAFKTFISATIFQCSTSCSTYYYIEPAILITSRVCTNCHNATSLENNSYVFRYDLDENKINNGNKICKSAIDTSYCPYVDKIYGAPQWYVCRSALPCSFSWSLFETNNTCVQYCGANSYKFNNKCQTSCSTFILQTIISAVVVEQTCTLTCTDYVSSGSVCIPSCGIQSIMYKSTRYCPFCTSGVFDISTDGKTTQCITAVDCLKQTQGIDNVAITCTDTPCKDSTSLSSAYNSIWQEAGGICVKYCNSETGPAITKNRVVSSTENMCIGLTGCDVNFYYHLNKTCSQTRDLTQCPYYYPASGVFICVNDCTAALSLGYEIKHLGTCIAMCPLSLYLDTVLSVCVTACSYHWQLTNATLQRSCVPACSLGEFSLITTGQCITSCSTSQQFVFGSQLWCFDCAAGLLAVLQTNTVTCAAISVCPTVLFYYQTTYFRICVPTHCSQVVYTLPINGLEAFWLNPDINSFSNFTFSNGNVCQQTCPTYYLTQSIGGSDAYTCDTCAQPSNYRHTADTNGNKFCAANSAGIKRVYCNTVTITTIGQCSAACAPNYYASSIDKGKVDIINLAQAPPACVATCAFVDATGLYCVLNCIYAFLNANGQYQCRLTDTCLSSQYVIDMVTFKLCINACTKYHTFLLVNYCDTCAITQYFWFQDPTNFGCVNNDVVTCTKTLYKQFPNLPILCDDYNAYTCPGIGAFTTYQYKNGIECVDKCPIAFSFIDNAGSCTDCTALNAFRYVLDAGIRQCSSTYSLSLCPKYYKVSGYYNCDTTCKTIINEVEFIHNGQTICILENNCWAESNVSANYPMVDKQTRKCVSHCRLTNKYYTISGVNLFVCVPNCGGQPIDPVNGLCLNTSPDDCTANSMWKIQLQLTPMVLQVYCLPDIPPSVPIVKYVITKSMLTGCLAVETWPTTTNCATNYPSYLSRSIGSEHYCTDITCATQIFASQIDEFQTGQLCEIGVLGKCQSPLFYEALWIPLVKTCVSCEAAGNYKLMNQSCSLTQDPVQCAIRTQNGIFYDCSYGLCGSPVQYQYETGGLISCVFDCSVYDQAFSTDGKCTTQCYTGEFFEIITIVGQPKKYCVVACSSTNPIISTTKIFNVPQCISSVQCPASLTMNVNGHLLCNLCPSGQYIKVAVTTTIQSICVGDPISSSCAGSFLRYGDSFCINMDCKFASQIFSTIDKQVLQYYWQNQCLSICPDIYIIQANFSKQCTYCAGSQYRLTNGICSSVLDPPNCQKYYLDSVIAAPVLPLQCMTSCTASQYDMIGTSYCLPQCPSNKYTADHTCVDTCPSYATTDKKCTSWSSSYLIATDATNTLLLPIECGSLLFSASGKSFCSTCISSNYLTTADFIGFTCDASCTYNIFGSPTLGYLCVNIKCVFSNSLFSGSLANNKYLDGQNCVAACVSGFYKVVNGENVCVPCTGASDYQMPTGICATSCPVFYKSVSLYYICISSCPVNWRIQDGRCYQYCPSNSYSDSVNCLVSCPNYYTATVNELQCVDGPSSALKFINTANGRELLTVCSTANQFTATISGIQMNFCNHCSGLIQFITSPFTAQICTTTCSAALQLVVIGILCIKTTCSQAGSYNIAWVTYKFTDTDNDLTQCQPQCLTPRQFVNYIGLEFICTACDQVGQYQYINNTCSTTPCSQYNAEVGYLGPFQCVPACAATQYKQDAACRSVCSADYYSYNSASTKLCYQTCPDQLFKILLSGVLQCLDAVGSYFRNVPDDLTGPKELVSGCPGMSFTILSQLYCSKCVDKIRYESNKFLCYSSGICQNHLLSSLCYAASCSSVAIIFSSSVLQKLIFDNNGVCLDSCPSGYIISGAENICDLCVGLVVYPMDINGHTQCADILTRDKVRCPKYQIFPTQDPIQCVSVCPSGYLSYIDACVTFCPSGYQFEYDGSCYSACPLTAFYYSISISTGRILCQPSVPDGATLSTLDQKQIIPCTTFAFELNHIKYCSHCINQQILEYTLNTFVCRPQQYACPQILHGLLCIAVECSASQSVFYSSLTPTIYGQQISVYMNGNVCVQICPNYYQIIGSESICTDCSAPNSYKYLENPANSGLKLCKLGVPCTLYVYSSLQCVTTCPVNTFQSGSRCVQSCNSAESAPNFIVSGGTCISSCLLYIRNYLGNSSQLECVSQVEPGLFVSTADRKTILQTCSSQVFTVSSTKYCSHCQDVIRTADFACLSRISCADLLIQNVCSAGPCSVSTALVGVSLNYLQGNTCQTGCIKTQELVSASGTSYLCKPCNTDGYWLQNNLCSATWLAAWSCLKYTVVNKINVCQTDTCDLALEHTISSTPVIECVTTCTGLVDVISGQKSCQDTCVSGYYDIQNTMKVCVQTCSLFKQIILGKYVLKQCQSTCTLIVPPATSGQNQECVDQCNFPYFTITYLNQQYCNQCSDKLIFAGSSSYCVASAIATPNMFCISQKVCSQLKCDILGPLINAAQYQSMIFTDGSNCISKCISYVYSENKTCTTCSSALEYRNLDGICSSQQTAGCTKYLDQVPYQCVSFCDITQGWYDSGAKCIQLCQTYITQVGNVATCQLSCPQNIYSITTYGKLCISECQYVIQTDNGLCRPQQLNDILFTLNGIIYSNGCGANLFVTSLGNNLFQCDAKCTKITQGFLCTSLTCDKAGDIFPDTVMALYYRNVANVCSQCLIFVDPVNKRCQDVCTYQFRYENLVCTDCSKSGEYRQINGICATVLDVTQCKYYNQTNSYAQCLESCPKFTSNNICVDICPNFVDLNICVDQCSTFTYKLTEGQRYCVAECGDFSVTGITIAGQATMQCIDQCLFTYLVNSVIRCAVSCQDAPAETTCINFAKQIPICNGVISGDKCLTDNSCVGDVRQSVCVPAISCGVREVIVGGSCAILTDQIYQKLPNGMKIKVICTTGLRLGQVCVTFQCGEKLIWVENGCYAAEQCRGVIKGGVCVIDHVTYVDEWNDI